MTQTNSFYPQFPANSLEEKIQQPMALSGKCSTEQLKSTQMLEQKQANFNLAIEKIKQSTVSRQSSRTINIFSNVSHFREFGPTPYLFFTFIKKCIIFFLVLAVISLIPVLYNRIAGSEYSQSAVGANVVFARTTIGAHSSNSANQYQAKVVNTLSTALILSAFFIFWLYWKHYLSIQKIILKQQFRLINSNAVTVEDVPKHITTEQLTAYLVKFGAVQQLVPVINRGQLIRIASEVSQLEFQIQQIQKSAQMTAKDEDLFTQNRRRITVLEKQFTQQKLKTTNKTVKYFVRFQQQQICKQVINRFNKASCLCLHQQYPEQLLLNDCQINITKCQAQPSQIYWQNQHVTFKELLKPNLILLGLVNIISLLTIVLIALVSASTQPIYYNPSYPSNSLTEKLIMAESNSTLIASWCLSNSYNSSMVDTCTTYTNLSGSRMNIYLGISIIILLARLLTKIVILHMAKYLRFKDKVELSLGVMFHLFVNYTMISVLVTLSVQSNLFGTAMGTMISSFISQQPLQQNINQLQYYSDYTSQWYLDYGFQLALNLILACIFPHVLAPVIEFCIRKWKLQNINKIKQSSLQNYLSLSQFQIEDHYASCFMLILVGMLFSGGSPIMIPIILIGLSLKYLSAKFMFIYFNKIPDVTGPYLVSRTPLLLLVCFIVYFINTIWAYGVEDIFSPLTTLFSANGIDGSSNAKTVSEAFLVFLRRLLNSWALAVVFLFGIVVICFRKKISNISHRLIQKYIISEKQTAKVEINLQNVSQQHRLDSYLPRNQQKYNRVWQTLDRLLAE